LEAVGEKIPDLRRAGGNRKYRLLDGLKCAFAVFFFMHPSLLDFQRAMQGRRKRNNVETLFGVTGIPRGNQIRKPLDGVYPKVMGEAFGNNLLAAEEAGALDGYRVLEGGVLLALDGVRYHSSKEISCKHCLHMTDKNGETNYYYHSAAAGAILKPGSGAALPDGGTNTERGRREETGLRA
jgi:hypothetical protein